MTNFKSALLKSASDAASIEKLRRGGTLVVDNNEDSAKIDFRDGEFRFDNNRYDHYEATAAGMAQYLKKHGYRSVGWE
jgi:hypothetical protein